MRLKHFSLNIYEKKNQSSHSLRALLYDRWPIIFPLYFKRIDYYIYYSRKKVFINGEKCAPILHYYKISFPNPLPAPIQLRAHACVYFI